MENQKFRLNSATLLIVGSTLINGNVRTPIINGKKYFCPSFSDNVDVVDSVNFPTFEMYDYSSIETVQQFIECKLYFSSEIDVNSVGYMLAIKDRENNFLTSIVGYYWKSMPMQIVNHKNTLYTTSVTFYLPYDLVNDNLQFYINNNVYIDNENIVIDNKTSTGLTPLNPNNISYENLKSDIINDANVDVDLKINDNKFLEITPKCLVVNKTIEQYLLETFDIEGYVPEISLKYQINFVNSSGTYDRITVSNDDDIYGKIKLMIDTAGYLVTSINDLPLTIFVVMVIEIDKFKIHRESKINYNYILKNPNTIIDSLELSDLTSKQIVEKVVVVNQDIVQTPSSNDPVIKLLKMETPIFTNILTENVNLNDFIGYIKFTSLIGINIDNNIKVVLNINDEMVYAINDVNDNTKLIFNVNSLSVTPSVNDEYKILLINDNPSNMSDNTQIILTGKIV